MPTGARPWAARASRTLFPREAELVKKFDDDRGASRSSPLLRSAGGSRNYLWRPSIVPPRRALKRLALIALAAAAVYLFVANIPTDVPVRDRRRPVYRHPEPGSGDAGRGGRAGQVGGGRGDDLFGIGHGSQGGVVGELPLRPGGIGGSGGRQHQGQGRGGGAKNSAGPGGVIKDENSDRTYNGPVTFPGLSGSIQAIGMTGGVYTSNKNVMFAAASMRSVTALLPLACQMGMERRSYVHFVLMGRSTISVTDLLALNGVDDLCLVIFHDARPDSADVSSDVRVRTAASKAYDIIYPYMHPQAIIIDGSKTEDEFFVTGLREKAQELKSTLIELPDANSKNLLWITKLDSSSLAAWNKISIEILIQASPGASGNLIRLLKSLSRADYSGCHIPHLTVELPQKIDPPTEAFLENFQWPPNLMEVPANARLLTLRHRIPRHGLNEEESQVRFLESFWPAHKHSHILILSPQVELAPNYFHYLKYTLLEYKYSSSAFWQEWDRRLLGISLDVPATYLNASRSFSPPTKGPSQNAQGGAPETPSSFLWQAPNSNAVLFLGDKWMELHGFVTRFLEAQRNFTSPPPTLVRMKSVSKRFPSWLEHALRLSRARGYFTLYPSPDTAKNIAAVHNELFHPPEEYENDDEVGELEADGAKVNAPTEVKLSSGPLLDNLPHGGGLVPVNDLPLLTWDGRKSTLAQIDESAGDYTLMFKRTIGNCREGENQVVAHKYAADLFCRSGFPDTL